MDSYIVTPQIGGQGEYMPDSKQAEARFGFGANWLNFIKKLTEDRIKSAEESLKTMLPLESLAGKSFLDIGSGSGLFSLAAYRLGAEVVSFDYDENSVAATRALQERYKEQGGRPWRVEQGSVLDSAYLTSLGQFDIVYSWGVLHHTGDLWSAISAAAGTVAPSGLFYIALYNKQTMSPFWTRVKKAYNSGPAGQILITSLFVPPITLFQLLRSLALTGNPLRHFTDHKERGMSPFHDSLDWIGGYPFEVSSPGEVLDFMRGLNFTLESMRTTNGHGCNEFLFRKT